MVPVLFSLFCAQPGCARATDPSQTKTIFVFGDSLSEGVAITPHQAWPMLLVEKLHAIGPNFRVINASASGGTTEGGLRRLPPHLEHPIDIFILELGINDAFNGIPLEQTRANLQSIIDQVKARNPNASIVIVGIQFPIAAPDRLRKSRGKYPQAHTNIEPGDWGGNQPTRREPPRRTARA